MTSYHKKYIKYKNKYLGLKGGSNVNDIFETIKNLTVKLYQNKDDIKIQNKIIEQVKIILDNNITLDNKIKLFKIINDIIKNNNYNYNNEIFNLRILIYNKIPIDKDNNIQVQNILNKIIISNDEYEYLKNAHMLSANLDEYDNICNYIYAHLSTKEICNNEYKQSLSNYKENQGNYINENLIKIMSNVLYISESLYKQLPKDLQNNYQLYDNKYFNMNNLYKLVNYNEITEYEYKVLSFFGKINKNDYYKNNNKWIKKSKTS